jgi:hypothetical protein
MVSTLPRGSLFTALVPDPQMVPQATASARTSVGMISFRCNDRHGVSRPYFWHVERAPVKRENAVLQYSQAHRPPMFLLSNAVFHPRGDAFEQDDSWAATQLPGARARRLELK